jgi:hypothetical protein
MQVTRLRLTVTAAVAAFGLAVGSAAAAVAGAGVRSASGPRRITSNRSEPGTRAGLGSAARLSAARSQPARPITVTLPTGDRMRVDPGPDGQPSITPELAAGVKPGPASFVRFSSGGEQYVVPDPAVPYLRSTLDPRLFDVSYLARARLATIPVKITYTSARAIAALPGVRVTRRSGTTASATITPAKAARLGQTLATQWRSARTGHSTSGAGLLPGIAHIGLVRASGAPPLPAAPARRIPARATQGPGLPFYTLKVNLTNLNGKSGVAVGWVQNVADANLALNVFSNGGGTPAGAVQGPISVAVPKGTYSLVFSILTPHAADSGFDTALVVKPQVTVNSDTTVTLDARTAVPFRSSVPSVNAPVRIDRIDVTRFSVANGGIDTATPGDFIDLFMALVSVSPGTLFPGELPTRLLATPTAAAKQGAFGFDASTQLWPSLDAVNGSESARPTYLLDFPTGNRIPASLHYTVPADRLTRVHEQVYDTPSDSCAGSQRQLTTDVYHPWGTRQGIDFAVPAGSRTDYWYTSAPRLSTFQQFVAATDCTTRAGARRHITQGGQISEIWNKAPLVPSPASPTVEGNVLGTTITHPALAACAACRENNNAVLFLSAFGDSDRAHSWNTHQVVNDVLPVSALRFYRNGAITFDSSAYNLSSVGGVSPFGIDLPLLPRPATYRLAWTQSHAGDKSASNETDWTFHSGPADAPARLPSAVECAPDPARACSFLPLLFISYDLALNFSNQAAANNPEAINFTVEGQQHAPVPAGVTATVSASFDDGKIWTKPVRATSLGHDTFSALINQPALASTSGFVSLRVHAQDAAGNTVDQTIIRAYGLTG